MTMKLGAALGAAAVLLCASNAAEGASDRADVVALGQKAFAAFNRGDMDAVANLVSTGDHEILDNFPPFHWGGPQAYPTWLASLGKDAEERKITDTRSVLGKATFVRVCGDMAFVTAPDTYTYKSAGKPVREDLIFSYVAHKTPGGWKLVSWSVAGGPRR